MSKEMKKLDLQTAKSNKISVTAILLIIEAVVLVGCLISTLISLGNFDKGVGCLWFGFALIVAMMLIHLVSFIIKPKVGLYNVAIMGVQAFVGTVLTVLAVVCNFISAFLTKSVIAGYVSGEYAAGHSGSLWILTIFAVVLTVLSIVGCCVHLSKKSADK